MLLSVVIPTLNRLDNLKLCLAALWMQTFQDFEVVVIDDGSTDGTVEWLKAITKKGKAKPDYVPKKTWWLKAGPNKGFNGGRVRNIGSFNANGERLVFIDSDVLLREDALEHYSIAHHHHPDAAICGLYHSLPPMKVALDDVIERFSAIEKEELPEIDQSYNGPWWFTEKQYPRHDPREDDFWDDPARAEKGKGLGSFCGNVSYPYARFWEIGGFDERLPGYGGEDADIGLTWDEHGFDWVQYRKIVGYHVHHPRNQEKNHKEVQINIAYIDKKHGVGRYKNAEKWTDSQSWTDWHHYTKDLGTALVKARDEMTVYAVRDTHRIGLTSPEWVEALGFKSEDIVEIPNYAYEGIIVEGTTPEWATILQV